MSSSARGIIRGGLIVTSVLVFYRPDTLAADTLPWALTQAYQNNPTLNAQRAAVRATDETVPQALSGYRPRVSLSATAGEQYLDTHTKTAAGGVVTYSQTSGNVGVQTYGGTITQTLLNGFGTASRTRQ